MLTSRCPRVFAGGGSIMVVNKCSVCGGDAVFREHPDKDAYVVSCCGVTYKVKRRSLANRRSIPLD
jgi:uncharacterized protein (DUF983 family)